jgi:hypothetical protein
MGGEGREITDQMDGVKRNKRNLKMSEMEKKNGIKRRDKEIEFH